MFNRTYYVLQAKKLGWLSVLATTAILSILQAPVMPLTLMGLLLGVSALQILPLFNKTISTLFLLTTPLLVLATPIALPFNVGFLGLIAYRLSSSDKITKALEKTHAMGDKEKDDLAQVEKLERKTGIKVAEKHICEVDAKKFSPNAAASGGLANHEIYIFDNILKAPFTAKEKKAVFAHEFGHLKNKDFLATVTSNLLYWNTIACAFFAFSAPVALLIALTAHFASYGVSQACELLADQFAAEHANPRQLMGALDKIVAQKKIIDTNNKEHGLWERPKSLLNDLKRKTGMISHPAAAVRKSYLAGYAIEKDAVKQRRAP